MKTIEKILWYSVISEYNTELLRKWGFYNWTGADWVFFDTLIDNIFAILTQADVFDSEKSIELRKDIVQLVIRHDIETWFKCWFFRSNYRLASGLYKLLHHFDFKYRFIVSFVIFRIVSGATAKKNYKKFK